jgi:uncharacterized protein YecE (DUF72 family)
MAAFIGTSGWSYDHWEGVLYPKPVKSLERLDAYPRHFHTVEVNNSFHHWPKDEVESTCRHRSPDDFVSAHKARRGLTQFRELKVPEPWLDRSNVKRIRPCTERIHQTNSMIAPTPNNHPPPWRMSPQFETCRSRNGHLRGAGSKSMSP